MGLTHGATKGGPAGSVLCFGPFRFDVVACRLLRDGVEIHLTPKAAAVLRLLLQRPGELVGKDEFLETVWEGIFVREESLTQAISVIRQALGDSAQSPRYIQTVSGEGYRFIGEVGPGASLPPAPPPTPRQRPMRWRVVVAAALVAMVSIAWFAAYTFELVTGDSPAGNDSAGEPTVTPLTSFEGYERWPAISPDGKLVAFIAEGRHGGRRHLYVKLLGGRSQAKQLTFGDSDHAAPAWAPEGDRIVFYRWTLGDAEDEMWQRGDPEVEILTITPLGTDEKLVARVPDCISAVAGIDWSPDAGYLVYPACSEAGAPGLFLMSMKNRTVEQITYAPQEPRAFRDVMPKFSPDGETVAFIRLTNDGEDIVGVYVQDIADGKGSGAARPLESINARNHLVHDIGWTDDGNLMWSAGDSFASTFLSVTSVASGETERLAVGARARHFSIFRNLLVYVELQDDYSIRRIGGPLASEPGVPEVWAPSTWDDVHPHYAPSGDHVVFTSDRDGVMDVRMADADGRNVEKLTDSFAFTVYPQFSPAGPTIAFSAVGPGGSRQYVLSLDGGFPIDLSQGDFGEGVGAWSDDGEWIYYQSVRRGGETYEIWRVRPDGSERQQITAGGDFVPRPHRGRVYFSRQGRVWSAAAGGGDEKLVLDEQIHVGGWTVWSGKIVYLRPLDPDHAEDPSASFRRVAVMIYDLETRATRQHATVRFAPGLMDARHRLTVSPDGRFILYSGRERAGSDLKLVENFR